MDFIHKPIETDILRSKADVFFELYRQRHRSPRNVMNWRDRQWHLGRRPAARTSSCSR